MIGLSLQQDSRVRSNRARFLALFLAIGVINHGLYYPKDWLVFGFAISFYVIASHWSERFKLGSGNYFALGLTDALMLVMIILSGLGLAHPVKAADGIMEALHWGIFWLTYRLGVRISSDQKTKEKLLNYIEWLAIAVAIMGWLPWIGKVAGRLSSVFGYPNAMAAFLGTVLLLNPQRKLAQILLVISLLATGSRAGVGLFVVIFTGQKFILSRQAGGIWNPILASGNYLRRLWLIGLVISGIVLIILNNRTAWENLTNWSVFSSSWQERLVYFKDGIRLAWDARGLPQAGGWLAFPTVQHFPYWTADPHSSFIHILLNQGFLGVLCVGTWGSLWLAQAWKTWREKRKFYKTGDDYLENKAEIQVWAALLFLGLHSLVDADFSFGSLGCLFWLLFGSLQKLDPHSRSFYSKRTWKHSISNQVIMVFSGLLCFACGSLLFNPTYIEKEQTWNAYAVQWSELDSERSISFWDKSLIWDQTQSSTRQKRAEHLLKHGEIISGLVAVEEVLKWQPYNMEAYEWAQSVVWDAAEVQRTTNPETANRLYRWVEEVPNNMDERVKGLTSTERLLWQGHQDFSPSPHIMLLAEYARQRQLTQLLFKT